MVEWVGCAELGELVRRITITLAHPYLSLIKKDSQPKGPLLVIHTCNTVLPIALYLLKVVPGQLIGSIARVVKVLHKHSKCFWIVARIYR